MKNKGIMRVKRKTKEIKNQLFGDLNGFPLAAKKLAIAYAAVIPKKNNFILSNGSYVIFGDVTTVTSKTPINGQLDTDFDTPKLYNTILKRSRIGLSAYSSPTKGILF